MDRRFLIGVISPMLLVALLVANTQQAMSLDTQQASATPTVVLTSPTATPIPSTDAETPIAPTTGTPLAGEAWILDLLKILLSWPVILGLALLAFRQPLTKFLEDMGQRATKISIAQFSLELPESKGPPPVWTGSQLVEALQSSALTSGVQALLDQFETKDTFDHLVVNIGDGHQWLTSRLFLFAAMLKRMNSLDCIVFLHTRANKPRTFLGVANAELVRWELARQYPWFEAAYAHAYADMLENVRPQDQTAVRPFIKSSAGSLDPHVASRVATKFLQAIQYREDREIAISEPLPKEFQYEWVRLERRGENSILERAKWLDETAVRSDLQAVLLTDAFVIDSPDLSSTKRQKHIVNRRGRFVALVDEEKIFQKLINRQALVEEICRNLARPVDD